MKRILIIDDTKEIRTLLSLILFKQGYKAISVESPVELGALFKECPFNLIILDIEMPLINGIKIARNLTDRLGKSRPPIIFQTSEKRKEYIDDALSLSPDSYLLKPVKKSTLLETIERTIKKQPNFTFPVVHTGQRRSKSFELLGYNGAFDLISISDIGIEISAEKSFSPEEKLTAKSNLLKGIGVPELKLRVGCQTLEPSSKWRVFLQYQHIQWSTLNRLKDWINMNNFSKTK